MVEVTIKCIDNNIEQYFKGRMAVGSIKDGEKIKIFAVGLTDPEEMLETLADAFVQVGKHIFKTDGSKEAEQMLWMLEKKMLKKAFEKDAEEVTE